MRIIRKLKRYWKEALRSGKIIEIKPVRPTRQTTTFKNFTTCETTEENWNNFVKEEEAFRSFLASRNVDYGRYICRGDYKSWLTVIRILSSIFFNSDKSFKHSQKPGQPWKTTFIKYCARIAFSLPHYDGKINDPTPLENLQKQLSYIKKNIQPYFTQQQFRSTSNNEESNSPVSKEKLIQLWFENKKQAIEIITNDGLWPSVTRAVIDKQKTEEYYEQKYNIERSDLKAIVKDYPDDNVPIAEFLPQEVRPVIKALPNGKKWGYDGVRCEDLKENLDDINTEICNVLNSLITFRKTPRTWKHALIRRNPKKKYDPNDLSTLRDISLLPTFYKLFAKCLVNRILPKIIDTSVRFWQRAYIKERDRQELIFLLKTAIDDFRHISSKFYTIFVDFRDAFGSLNQDYLIRTLLNSDIAKGYCEIIADIYQDSHFQVICGKELTKEFLLTKGTKTGCPLSAVLFIIDLDKSLKEVHSLAIISRNIEDEKRISPIPAGGYADDVVLISYVEIKLKICYLV